MMEWSSGTLREAAEDVSGPPQRTSHRWPARGPQTTRSLPPSIGIWAPVVAENSSEHNLTTAAPTKALLTADIRGAPCGCWRRPLHRRFQQDFDRSDFHRQAGGRVGLARRLLFDRFLNPARRVGGPITRPGLTFTRLNFGFTRPGVATGGPLWESSPCGGSYVGERGEAQWWNL